jgi:hypothetical protein
MLTCRFSRPRRSVALHHQSRAAGQGLQRPSKAFCMAPATIRHHLAVVNPHGQVDRDLGVRGQGLGDAGGWGEVGGHSAGFTTFD